MNKVIFPQERDIGVSYSRMLLQDTMLKTVIVLVLQSVQSVNVEHNLNQLNIFCYDARDMRMPGTG